MAPGEDVDPRVQVLNSAGFAFSFGSTECMCDELSTFPLDDEKLNGGREPAHNRHQCEICIAGERFWCPHENLAGVEAFFFLDASLVCRCFSCFSEKNIFLIPDTNFIKGHY